MTEQTSSVLAVEDYGSFHILGDASSEGQHAYWTCCRYDCAYNRVDGAFLHLYRQVCAVTRRRSCAGHLSPCCQGDFLPASLPGATSLGNYLRAEIHLVYQPPSIDATEVTFAWEDEKGEHVASNLFTGAAGELQTWKLSTGQSTRTRWVEYRPVPHE